MIKRITVLIIILQISLLSIISVSYAKYISNSKGKVSIAVAKPISRIEVKDDIYISNYEQKPINISVYNFDEKGKISDTKMNYKFIIKFTQANAPLKFKLFRVYDDREEEAKISVSNGIVTKTNWISMNAGVKTTHNYRLEIEYDNTSNVQLASNIEATITLQSVQIKP